MTVNPLLAAAAALVFALVLYRALYNLFLSPLSAIPGPWYAAVSGLWINYHVLCLRQCKTIQSLFERYGPVVRISPNKVVFCDASAMRAVYSVHKFDKSSYYKGLLTNDHDHAMTTLDHASHTIRRKSYSPHYTSTNIAKFQPDIHEFALQLVDVLENIGGKSSLECMALFRNLMVDVMTETLFGYRLGALGKWAMEGEDPLSTAINDFPKRGLSRSVMPSWAWKLISRIPNERWKKLCSSDSIMAEFVIKRVYEARSQINSGVGLGEPERPTLLQRLLQHRYSAKHPVPDSDIISECMGHFIAGSDTSSTTITYILWELSRRPDILSKVQEELDDAMPDARLIPDISVLQGLPYFNALLQEALRLYTAAPSLLERVVPSAASKLNLEDEAFDLLGYALPAGTIVATQAWSMHRHPDIFPDPESFVPERWMPSSSSPQQLFSMHQHLMAFGTGTRVCGGNNLAQIVLRAVIATIIRNFNVIAPKETTERSMEIKDSFVIFPAAMECKLIFKPRC